MAELNSEVGADVGAADGAFVSPTFVGAADGALVDEVAASFWPEEQWLPT